MTDRQCELCGTSFTPAHKAHRFCSTQHRRHAAREKRKVRPRFGEVAAATEKAIKAATHLTDMDLGAVAALRVLAVKIDGIASETVTTLDEFKARFDNVTLPTYLKYCEALGLTPSGRGGVKSEKGGRGGKLLALSGGIPKPGQTA